MTYATVSNFVKRRKALVAFSLLVVVYLGAGIAFREYRMDPENGYYSTHLPSAARPPSIASTPEEAIEQLKGDLFTEPNLLERFFMPAEWLFRQTGY